MLPPKSPQSRAVALLLLAALIFVVLRYVELPALQSVAADRAALAARPPAISAAPSGQLRDFLAAASWHLDGTTPELISAQVQRAVEQSAAQEGASVSSVRAVPAAADHGFTRVSLEFEMAATLPQLQALLHDIAAARPRLFIDRLTVQAPEGGSTAKGPDGQSELAVALHLALYARSAPGAKS